MHAKAVIEYIGKEGEQWGRNQKYGKMISTTYACGSIILLGVGLEYTNLREL